MMNFSKKTLGLLVGIGLLTGSAITIGLQSKAQTSTTDTDQPSAKQFDPTKGGHVGQNGVREELLTGDSAEKVKAAALAANPGATIQRVETDAEGAAFEAHITKSDGSMATVKLDNNYSVTATDDGPGHRK